MRPWSPSASGSRFTFEQPDFLQDGCPYRALAVWPEGDQQIAQFPRG
jgi:hypothetical protein